MSADGAYRTAGGETWLSAAALAQSSDPEALKAWATKGLELRATEMVRGLHWAARRTGGLVAVSVRERLGGTPGVVRIAVTAAPAAEDLA